MLHFPFHSSHIIWSVAAQLTPIFLLTIGITPSTSGVKLSTHIGHQSTFSFQHIFVRGFPSSRYQVSGLSSLLLNAMNQRFMDRILSTVFVWCKFQHIFIHYSPSLYKSPLGEFFCNAAIGVGVHSPLFHVSLRLFLI